MKNLIDYASQDNGTEFRAELYAAIHDKVSAHIDAKKQEIASGLMGQQSEEVEEELDEDDDSPELKYAIATSLKASKLHGSTNPIKNIQGHLLDRKASKLFKKTPEHSAWKEKYGVKEEVESLDEISADKIIDYSEKAQKSYADPKTSDAKKANRKTGLMTGYQKLKARAKVPATYGED